MTSLTLTFVRRTPKTSQAGKPYTSLSIKCNEYGDKYLSGFDGKETASWKVGDTVEADVEEKGQYLNFKVPKATFSKVPGAPDVNRIELKMNANHVAVMTELQMIRGLLSKAPDEPQF